MDGDGAVGGGHRFARCLRGPGVAPFAWRTGVTSPRHGCRGGVS